MICSLQKGHIGQCIPGEPGGCKKTAEKWFELEARDPDILTQEELAVMTEGQLVAAYRRTHVPSTQKEAVAWAREFIAARESA